MLSFEFLNIFARLDGYQVEGVSMHNAIASWWNDSARAGDVTIPGKHFYSDAPWNATQPALKPVYAHSNCDPVSFRSS